jgi:hypothetical protein
MVRLVVAIVVTMLGVCASPRLMLAQDTVQEALLAVRMTAPAGTDGGLPSPAAPSIRGSMLPLLYSGFIGLQGYDAYSTNRGVKNGASESNAILGLLTKHPAAVWAVKGGVTFASIYTAERLWRARHRRRAIAVMAVSTGIVAAVAANNALIIRAQP